MVAIAAAMAAVVGADLLFRGVLAQVLLLVLLLVAVMAVGVALRPDRRVPALCDPFVLCCVFLGQFYVIGPIVMATWGLSPILFFRAPGAEAAVPPLIAAVSLVACAIVGYRMELGRLVADRLPDFPPTARKFPRAVYVGAMVTAGLLGCLGWIEYQGGLMYKLGLSYGAGKSGAAFTLAFNAVITGTIVWAWTLMDGKVTRPRRYLFFVTLLAEVLFFGIIYGVRKYLFFLFFGLLACWSLRRGVRTLPKVRTAIVVAALLIFFSVWGAIRAMPVATMLGIGEASYTTQTSELQYGYFAGVGDPFGTACLVWQIFPAQEPFRHGSTLLVTVLGFIPRALWPEKPVSIGKELTRYYVGPFYEPTEGYSVTPTLPADFYLNFGWPGVLLGGFLLGVLCRVIVTYAATGMVDGVQERASRVLIPTFFVIGLGEVRADMSQVLAFYVMTGIPVLFGLLFFRMDGPVATPAGPREHLEPSLSPQAG